MIHKGDMVRIIRVKPDDPFDSEIDVSAFMNKFFYVEELDEDDSTNFGIRMDGSAGALSNELMWFWEEELEVVFSV